QYQKQAAPVMCPRKQLSGKEIVIRLVFFQRQVRSGKTKCNCFVVIGEDRFMIGLRQTTGSKRTSQIGRSELRIGRDGFIEFTQRTTRIVFVVKENAPAPVGNLA